MRTKLLGLGVASVVAVAGAVTMAPAQAQDTLYIPTFSYRTGPFAGSGIPVANGIVDYLTMLNERDGGIGGVRLVIEECETGYDTNRAIECYEKTKGKKPVIVNPYSTGATLSLIPKAAVDKIPILSMAYGLSASADGNNFPWIFNPPATYWDGASMVVRYIGDKEGGLDKLKGKTIGFIFFEGGYGREPIPLLQQLSKDYGFDLKLYPVTAQEMQNQSAQWLNVRRDRPAWMIMWGWGAMNPTAVKEAAKIRFPMDRFIGIWWSGSDDDARPAGPDAKGYLSLNMHEAGANFPAIQDIIKHVVDKGKSQVPSKDKVGESFYNRGVFNSVIMAEAIVNAQRLTGKKAITGEDARRGLESLEITEARWAQIGLPKFAAPFKVTCSDHNGHNSAFMQQWDGTKWVRASDWIAPMKDRVLPMIQAASKEYVEKATGWPKRTEPCDKAS